MQQSPRRRRRRARRGSSWVATYQRAGRAGLAGYLGTPHESGFDDLSTVVGEFANGADAILLRRMGRQDADVWYERVDLSTVHVLLIEWTHGLSDHLLGVDVPILLDSTPAQTLEHRRSRNRDGGVDSPFTTMVLGVEQELLDAQAQGPHRARQDRGAAYGCTRPCDGYLGRVPCLSAPRAPTPGPCSTPTPTASAVGCRARSTCCAA